MTQTTVIKPSTSDIDYKVENGQLTIGTNAAAKAGVYEVNVAVRAQEGTKTIQKDVTFKVKIHEKEKTIEAPVEPTVEPVAPVVEEPAMPEMPVVL